MRSLRGRWRRRPSKGRLPEPNTFSGQFVQRIPKSLHMRLAKRAATEGVSLNQLAATLRPRASLHDSGTQALWAA